MRVSIGALWKVRSRRGWARRSQAVQYAGPLSSHALVGLCLAAALGVMLSAPVFAQAFPTKPIRIVVPFSAGGGTDILARIVAQRLAEAWGQAGVVENRLGAAGTIGAAFVAKASADGYTLLMGTTSTHGIGPHLYKSLPYHPVNDFSAVSLVVWAPNVLVVHPSVPAKSVEQLIAFARARPGQLSFVSSGTGSSIHLAGELFKSMAKIEIIHVPYKGATPALIDLAAGQVHLMFSTVATALPFIEQSKLRPLGVTTPTRSSVLPSVPAIAEAGLPGYEMSGWIGLLAPANTPADVIGKINGEVRKLLTSPDVKQRLTTLGWDPVGSTPGEFAAVITRELPKYARIIKDAGMTPQ